MRNGTLKVRLDIPSSTFPVPEDATTNARSRWRVKPGLQLLPTARFCANTPGASPYELGRVAVLRDLTIEEFIATCQGSGLWKKRLQHQVRPSVQRGLGNHAYDYLRAVLLGESRQ